MVVSTLETTNGQGAAPDRDEVLRQLNDLITQTTRTIEKLESDVKDADQELMVLKRNLEAETNPLSKDTIDKKIKKKIGEVVKKKKAIESQNSYLSGYEKKRSQLQDAGDLEDVSRMTDLTAEVMKHTKIDTDGYRENEEVLHEKKMDMDEILNSLKESQADESVDELYKQFMNSDEGMEPAASNEPPKKDDYASIPMPSVPTEAPIALPSAPTHEAASRVNEPRVLETEGGSMSGLSPMQPKDVRLNDKLVDGESPSGLKPMQRNIPPPLTQQPPQMHSGHQYSDPIPNPYGVNRSPQPPNYGQPTQTSYYHYPSPMDPSPSTSGYPPVSSGSSAFGSSQPSYQNPIPMDDRLKSLNDF